MPRLKVCHIITVLELGGAQGNTLYTVRHLDRDRFDVLLLTGPGGLLDEETRSSNFRTVFVPHLVREVRPWSDLLGLWELTRLLFRERPQIVHTHSSKAGVLGRLAAFLACVPIRIHTFHGFGFHDRQPSWLRWGLIVAERLCARLSHALVFVSRANEAMAHRYGLGTPGQFRLIRSGIDFEAYPANIIEPGKVKRKVGLDGRGPVVISVGNLKPQKNPEEFVQLAKRVVEENHRVRFLFLGDGVLRPRVEALLLENKLQDRCLFAGWRRNTAELLMVSDIFVLTSLWEGLPRSLLEALRSGLPCVCYDTDGVRDLLEDGRNGFLVPQGDVEALAHRVLELLGDPGLQRRMGQEAVRSVGREFDIREMVRQQEALYAELAHGQTSP